MTADALQRAVWRDARQTAGEWMAWWDVRQAWPAARRLEVTLERWRLETAQELGYPSWPAYLSALEAERVARDAVGAFDQPPAEHRTSDPWPEGFPVPAAVARLMKLVDASWEARLGYCRGFRKVGRGNVGTGADARWELTHVVILGARPAGETGRAWVSIAYVAPAVDGPLRWKHDASSAPLEWKSTVAKAKGWLVQDSAVAIATVSASRQTVVPPTDMFAS